MFLFLFLPLTLGIYYISPKKIKNTSLLIASLFFYAWGEPVYVFLMIFSIIVDYINGMKVEKYIDLNQKEKAFKVVILSAVINLLILCFFKYSDFLISNLNAVFNLNMKLLNLPLPIGISFYTFQTMSYTIDIYKGEAKAQHNILDFGAYVTLFPQLVAGPIVRYETVATQINTREHSLEKFAEGVNRLIIGLSKKVILSNQLAIVADGVFSSSISSLSFLEAWIGIICYTLQIYYDFSGYSDMAIGLGKMFGFDFLENFNYPYISQTVSEFWRRWHISLGSWFRDYVYIPLGGSRISKVKLYRNLFIVWLLTGVWHGANWTFIVWGLYFGFFIILERAFLDKILCKIPQLFRHFYLMFVVIVGWVFFRADNIEYALSFIQKMFLIGDVSFLNPRFYIYINDIKWILLISIIMSTPIVKNALEAFCRRNNSSEDVIGVAQTIMLSVLFLASIIILINVNYNPFLYFRF